MKSLSLTTTAIAGLLGFSQVALAHPGHDHSFWASDAIHALALVSILAIGAAAVYLVKGRSKREEVKAKNEE